MECQSCYETILTPVYYQRMHQQKTLVYCYDCLALQLSIMWQNYIHKLKNPGCLPSLKRMLEEGPPLYFHDPQIDNNQEIEEFYYNQQVVSGKLINDDVYHPLTKELKLLDVEDAQLHEFVLDILSKYNLL